MFSSFFQHLRSIRSRDPSVSSLYEVFFCFPGYQAILWHRLNNRLWRFRLFFLARFFSLISRWVTGIEIHPGATIGKNLFIDHGFGVVIGETVVVGDNVTIYQGVTLGGTSPSINSDKQRQKKRHPSVNDGVIIGAGAKVLGPIMIGKDARVGANCIVTKDVQDYTVVAGPRCQEIFKPVEEHGKRKKSSKFLPYGTLAGSWASEFDRQVEAFKTELAEVRSELKSVRKLVDTKAASKIE